MSRAALRDHVGLLARLVLGVVLVVAGALKVGNPLGAARAVQAYDVLPFELARWIGYALPWVEIVVGVLLVLGLFTRVCAVIGTVLMLAFVIGIAQAWARGLSIDCGCFGGGGQVAPEQTKYGREIARDLGLAVCGAWLAIRSRSTWSLDRLLFGDKEMQ
ncbi:DoxX family membrane protein [Janibacter sp. CX7]|uniref:MauE/DoxX family redox-associated membrane protein n=1 Tax=unclassified Janibacter TaxID=2649294 RepID=UPI0020CE7638|nr:MauE/DoxX family redox-associated membrane protein [Janibacter sp. CX7]UTT64813.1 DoxX family membrane protein [Janibacter sp. CX7]